MKLKKNNLVLFMLTNKKKIKSIVVYNNDIIVVDTDNNIGRDLVNGIFYDLPKLNKCSYTFDKNVGRLTIYRKENVYNAIS